MNRLLHKLQLRLRSLAFRFAELKFAIAVE